MIEPTETETKERLDHFADVVRAILRGGGARTRRSPATRPTPRRCGASTRRAPPSGRWCAGAPTRRSTRVTSMRRRASKARSPSAGHHPGRAARWPRATTRCRSRPCATTDHAGRAALPADPLRHPGRGPGRPSGSRSAARWSARSASSLDELRARERVSAAGHLRVRRQRPRAARAAAGEPALADRGGGHRRVGAARRCAPLLEEAGVRARARWRLLFTGLDRGVEGGIAQDYERALPLADAERRPARLRDERRAAAAAARLPAAAGGARLVRHAERQVARRASPLLEEPFEGYQNAVAYHHVRRRRRARRAGHAHAAALADGSAGRARLHDARAPPRARPGRAARAAPGRARAPIERVEVSTDGGATFAGAELDAAARRGRLARLALRLARAARGEHELCSRATDAAGNTPAARARPGTSRATRTTRWSACG